MTRLDGHPPLTRSLALGVLVPAFREKGDSVMRLEDDGLCWLCDNPVDSERSATSWHGFAAHRACAQQEETRQDTTRDAAERGLDKSDVISTST